jgi:hypothetical protein
MLLEILNKVYFLYNNLKKQNFLIRNNSMLKKTISFKRDGLKKTASITNVFILIVIELYFKLSKKGVKYDWKITLYITI